MARATMAALITEMRVRIDDQAGTPHFTDDKIQTAYDANVYIARQEQLVACPQRAGAVLQYKEFIHKRKWWEGSTALALFDKDFNVSGGGFTEYAFEGRWVFAADQVNAYPISITGRAYDLGATACQLLTEWLATLKEEYSFATSGVATGRERAALSQKFGQVKALLAAYQAKAKPISVPNVRWDLED